MRAKSFRGAALVAALLFGGVILTGCRSATQLGSLPGDAPQVSVASLSSGKGASGAGQMVTLHGVMTEKCPTAFCWFRLKDKTGEIKVDLKGTTFTAAEIPVGAEVTVAGKPSGTGEAASLAATGVRYR